MAPMLTKKTLCLFEVDLSSGGLPSCEARLAVEYRLLDAVAWSEQPNVDHVTDRLLFQSRFERGEHIWTAHNEDDKIVSYCWVTTKPVEIGEIGCAINPRPDEIYLYDAFTFAEYRGQNLYPAVMHRILSHSQEAGLRRALIFVMSDNVASIRGVRKSGFREFQRVTYYNFVGLVRYSYRPHLSHAAGVDLLPA
ncbi:MAG: GNAT family N-acetyltransferase [Candidatus Tectomicrobia bacterium]|nr:GNAT family N-acetyltransferase [Candidatus Tectomicrobia bacterium]